MTRTQLVAALERAGSINPSGEADTLLEAARRDGSRLEELLDRRLEGEPLPWIVESAVFCGLRLVVEPGVFVPRPQTEGLARRGADLLPATGIALDLCTGSGAVAVVLATERPQATVMATDIDPVAIACATKNGIEALLGDLDEPVPREFEGRVDVVTAVPPYVPTAELHLLPRDALAFEPRASLDGGVGGTELLMRTAAAARRWLRPGGTILLELGGDQGTAISDLLAASGCTVMELHRDEDGDVRFIEATRVG